MMTETMQLTDIGITPRKASQFAAKGICTVRDLLMFYPTTISETLSASRMESSMRDSM